MKDIIKKISKSLTCFILCFCLFACNKQNNKDLINKFERAGFTVTVEDSESNSSVENYIENILSDEEKEKISEFSFYKIELYDDNSTQTAYGLIVSFPSDEDLYNHYVTVNSDGSIDTSTYDSYVSNNKINGRYYLYSSSGNDVNDLKIIFSNL